MKTWLEIARPFSLTASVVPVLVGTALAWQHGEFTWWLFLLAFAGTVLAQVGTNMVNEVYDVAAGVDRDDTPRASTAVLQGRLSPRGALTGAAVAFAVALAVGAALTAVQGWPILAIALAGGVAGYLYTAPPFAYKYRALGLPVVFFFMGPLIVVGAYYVQTGRFDWAAVWLSLPVGLLVTSILHANELRDVESDRRGGMLSVAMLTGRKAAAYLYAGMLVLAYVSVAAMVALRVAEPWVLVTFLTALLARRAIGTVMANAETPGDALAMIDVRTAQIHLLFGLALAAGLALSGF